MSFMDACHWQDSHLYGNYDYEEAMEGPDCYYGGTTRYYNRRSRGYKTRTKSTYCLKYKSVAAYSSGDTYYEAIKYRRIVHATEKAFLIEERKGVAYWCPKALLRNYEDKGVNTDLSKAFVYKHLNKRPVYLEK